MFLVRLADVDVKANDKPAPIAQKPPAPAKTTQAAKASPSAKPAQSAKTSQAAKPSQSTKAVETAKPSSANQPAQTAKTEPETPRFDFYHMLKENEVPVPEVEGTGTQAAAEPPKSYILQVASFRKSEDAEQLKVELILLNLEARAESVTVRNGEQWHRVLVGPFDSRSKLSKARSTLISNGHQALVMEHKPKT